VTNSALRHNRPCMTQAGGVNQGGLTPGSSRSGLDPVPYAVLLVALLISGAAAAYVGWATRAKDQVRFTEQVNHAHATVRRRIDLYVSMLRASAGLFAVNGDVDRAAFAEYTRQIDIRGNYPGLQGIGFALRVPPADADPVRARLAREWGRVVPLWPDRPATAERLTVLYLEPQDPRNLTAIGFDLASEATRRTAVDRARDTGEPVATGHVRLVSEAPGSAQRGFLILVPIYRGGAVPPTVPERRGALAGVVFSPLRADGTA